MSNAEAELGIAVVGAGRIGTLRARLAAKHPSVRFLAVSDIESRPRRSACRDDDRRYSLT